MKTLKVNAKEVLRAGEAPQSLILSPDNASRGPDERKFPAAMSSSYQLSAKGPVRPLHAPEACCTRNIQVRSNLLIPATPIKSRDNQMTKGQHKNITNKIN